MPDLLLPAYPGRERPPTPAVLEGIVAHDQFDDWLPDPAYYEDARLDPQPIVQAVDRAWAARRLTYAAADQIEIPRDGEGGFSALALPIDGRCCAHAVIAAMAPRISKAIERDKVYGFEFNAGAAPFFAEPGTGLKEALDTALAAAVVARDDLQVFDVTAFNRSLRFDVLARTLQRLGARPEEIELLRTVTTIAQAGLPSIDDAIAFVYNFYLEPVDRALMKARLNVFRYRDEYFVPGSAGPQRLNAELKALGLTARETGRFTEVNRKDELKTRSTFDKSAVEEILGPFLGGDITAFYECTKYDEDKICVTDEYEVAYEERGMAAIADLFALPRRRVYDGVRVLPLLRYVHGSRREGVFLQPRFVAPPARFESYQQIAAKGRAWLLDALTAAAAAKSAWQVTWTAAMLSDLGPLREPDVAALRGAAALPAPAGSAARLALARSSTLPAATAWAAPPANAGSYERRAAMLGAGYLAKRGISAPWTGMKNQAAAADRGLVDRIEAYLRSKVS